MLCFRCGSYTSDDAQKCSVCGQELVDKAGRSVGPAKKTLTTVLQAQIFAPGDMVANRYRVIEMIGQGGVGAVFRARDTEVDVDVALKGISPNLLQTDEEQKQFSRAIKAARKLQHANIVRIYDEGQHLQPNRRFFTMKLLEGLTLRKIIRLRHDKGQAFSPEELGPIFQQLASALDHAHKHAWHGDLKPENVVVLPDLLKVTDFGLVKGLPLKPFLGIAKSRSKGFPYIAPELRVEAQSIDGRCDIYSLGVILGEMLTGLVFEGHFSRAFTAALEQLPTRLDGLIRRALSDHPDGRFGRASEFAKELDLALGGLGGQPLPPPAQPKEGKEFGLATSLKAAERPAQKVADTPPERPAAVERARPSPPPPPLETNPSQSIPPSLPGESVSEEDSPLLEIGQSQVLLLEQSAAEAKGEARVVRDETRQGGAQAAERAASERRLQAIDGRNADDTIDEPTLQSAPGDDIDTNPGGRALLRKKGLPADDAPPRADDLIASLYADEGERLTPPPLPDDSLLENSSGLGLSAISDGEDESTVEGRMLRTGAGHAPVALPSEPSSDGADGSGGAGVVDGAGDSEGDGDATLGGPDGATERLPSLPSSSEVTGERRASAADVLGLGSDEKVEARNPVTARSEAGEAIHEALTALKRHPRPDLVDDDALRDALTRTAGTAVDRETPPALPAEIHEDDSLNDTRTATMQAEDAAVLGDHDLLPPPVVVPALRPVAPPRAASTSSAGPSPWLVAAGVAVVMITVLLGGRQLLKGDEHREDGALVTVHTPSQAPDGLADAGPSAAIAVPPDGASASPTSATSATASPASAAGASPTAPVSAGADDAARLRLEREEAERRAAEEMERREAAARATTPPPTSGTASGTTPATTSGAAATASAGSSTTTSSPDATRVDAKPDTKGDTVALATGTCPAGMARVDGGSFSFGTSGADPLRNFGEIDASNVDVKGFCIDYYEAPNGKDALPTTGVSWTAAKNACDRAGKRLCTEVEWERACKGPSSSRFPYGNTYDADTCNTEDGDGKARSLARPVDFKKCRSGFKVFMLAGNAEEWVQDAAGGQKVLKGGSADLPDFASRCSARRTVAAKTASATIGFRCCADVR